jgi:hypothetical protein
MLQKEVKSESLELFFKEAGVSPSNKLSVEHQFSPFINAPQSSEPIVMVPFSFRSVDSYLNLLTNNIRWFTDIFGREVGAKIWNCNAVFQSKISVPLNNKNEIALRVGRGFIESSQGISFRVVEGSNTYQANHKIWSSHNGTVEAYATEEPNSLVINQVQGRSIGALIAITTRIFDYTDFRNLSTQRELEESLKYCIEKRVKLYLDSTPWPEQTFISIADFIAKKAKEDFLGNIASSTDFSKTIKNAAKEQVKVENISLKATLFGCQPELIAFASLILWANNHGIDTLYGTRAEQQVALVHHYKGQENIPPINPYSKIYKKFGFRPPDPKESNNMLKDYWNLKLFKKNDQTLLSRFTIKEGSKVSEKEVSLEGHLRSILNVDTDIYEVVKQAVDSLELYSYHAQT